ncbi:MAG: AAA family ATPase [Oscillospiraceae bacterium]|nr:AAA family ATPase [Oscillospiraceae bacterium]
MIYLSTNSQKSLKKHLANLFRARFPFIYISSWEETRLCNLISDLAADQQLIRTARKVYVWSETTGIRALDTDIPVNADSNKPESALSFIEKCEDPSIFILKDFHVYFGTDHRAPNSNIVRKVRDLVEILKESDVAKNVVFISPTVVLPIELQKDVTIVDFNLPSVDEILDLLNETIEANIGNPKINICLTEEDKISLCNAAQGLTIQEAENAFARAIVESGALTINERSIILDEKCQVIKKTGILEFIKSDLRIEDIGGLENLKKWLLKRNKSWSKEAKAYSLPAPKGILIAGVAGCGKSLTAKAISAMWNLPLLRLDMGKIFSGVVGSSEENMRKAIKTAEAVAPSVLWVDEIEKGLGGVTSSGDSGTSMRVFGSFLTWMQEKTLPVFVVATANKIDALPAELLRKGRFDEIFFVDLPTKNERKEIFSLHLRKRIKDNPIGQNVDYNDDNTLSMLADLTEGFGGAEIEQIIIAALFEAFYDSRNLETNDIIKSIKNTVPLSVTQSEQIIQIREWANVRAVAATATEDRNEYQHDIESIVKKESEDEQIRLKRNRGGRSVDF